jgi:hypothetical protein
MEISSQEEHKQGNEVPEGKSIRNHEEENGSMLGLECKRDGT